jgi:hypothetical protein
LIPIDLDEAVELIRAEYAKMPGLSMTAKQVRRVWSLSNEVCEEALTSLTRSGFLIENRHCSFVRARNSLPAAVEPRGGTVPSRSVISLAD